MGIGDTTAPALSAEEEHRIRTVLGGKLAGLSPAETRGDLQREAVANLTALVAQAALRVRTNVAEAVRNLPDGPREIVLRLAHDPEVMVAEPVIRFSPMLTTEDLVTLVATAPTPATVSAVARRAGIDEAVSDAVVGSSDVKAIAALLSNHSAQIRETTLDALAAQSEAHTEWQEPLVRRPALPTRAQRVLADIVTGSLLESLAARPDLDPRIAQQVRRALAAVQPGQTGDLRPPAALARAQGLRDAGRLDDMAMLEALRSNALVLATAMFAVRAGVPVTMIEQVFGLRNAKAVVALAWKAGMSMQTAIVVQAALARLPPDIIIRGGPNNSYPLQEDEMRRQLTSLGVAEAGPRRWVPRRVGG